jgi:hypothetical protein
VFRYILISFTLLTGYFGFGQNIDSYTLELQENGNSQHIRVQSGDILLRKGKGWLSQLMSHHLNERYPFSHVGIFYKVEEEKAWVVHSISNDDCSGICIVPVENFVSEAVAGSFAVIRPKRDWINISMLQSKILAHLTQEPIDFDFYFDEADDTKMFCSEFVWFLLQGVGLEKRDWNFCQIQNKRVRAFSNFLDKNFFEYVYFPLSGF